MDQTHQSYAPSGSERPYSEGVNPDVTVNGDGVGNGNGNPAAAASTVDPPGGGEVSTGKAWFLPCTLGLGLIGWLIALISQAIVAATISNAPVRILWFGFIIQTILIILVVEVLLGSATYNAAYAYGTQISVFAALATVFAVLGVDQNIYSSEPAQKATGAGWLVLAIVDLLWILIFTSPPHSPVIRVMSALERPRAARQRRKSSKVEKIGRSTDAFPMSPVVNDNRDAEGQTQTRKAGGVWNMYNPPQAPTSMIMSVPSSRRGRPAGGAAPRTEGSEPTISVRPDSGTAPPEAEDHGPEPTVTEAEPLAKWRAEALFDYGGSESDPTELSFKKGDVLLIVDRSGKWWDAIGRNGQRGIAPSNYLRQI